MYLMQRNKKMMIKKILFYSLLVLLISLPFSGCEQDSNNTIPATITPAVNGPMTGATANNKTEHEIPANATVVFAGGCFWCVEASLEKLDGVIEAVSGYSGGTSKNPTYKEVCNSIGGHLEVVKIQFDPTIISYNTLQEKFWHLIDPTDPSGSFVDRGPQYSSAIFYNSDAQKEVSETFKQALIDSKKFIRPIVTVIRPLEIFYEAETYHQDYYKKKPNHYHRYRNGTGRDQYIKKNWRK
jgi:peptide methionine sulfoxide reductase msrA/msrB